MTKLNQENSSKQCDKEISGLFKMWFYKLENWGHHPTPVESPPDALDGTQTHAHKAKGCGLTTSQVWSRGQFFLFLTDDEKCIYLDDTLM